MEVSIVKSRLSRWLAPLPLPLRRMLILVVGSTVVLFGVLLLVLPGPGILVIIVGLAILATEFAWASLAGRGTAARGARHQEVRPYRARGGVGRRPAVSGA